MMEKLGTCGVGASLGSYSRKMHICSPFGHYQITMIIHIKRAFLLYLGFIGKILLSIPWNRLNSAPWVITLERLYLVAGPGNAKVRVHSSII